MFYLIAGLVLLLAAYWLWGMRKMVRMNNDPAQIAMVNLLVRAGAGDEHELLLLINRQQWSRVQIADRVAHALTLAEKLLPRGDYFSAKLYADALQDRYEIFQTELRLSSLTKLAPRPSHPQDQGVRNAEGERSFSAVQDIQSHVAQAPPVRERLGFRTNEFIVYPAYGVGQIFAIEQQEIAGARLELFVINFVKANMTLRVPVEKIANVGMRKLSSSDTIQRAYATLSARPYLAEGSWTRLAKEYEAKINSGDIIALAEVVRDLYRPAVNPGQSVSEKQLYSTALDRLAGEVSVVQHITGEDALRDIETLVIAGASQRRT